MGDSLRIVVAALMLLSVTAGERLWAAEKPAVSIVLGSRHGHATPIRTGCNRTGGGNIAVQQLAPDTVSITMTGVGVAYPNPIQAAMAGFEFTLDQCFEIRFDDPTVPVATLVLEGQVVGLLRSHCQKSGAELAEACAVVSAEPGEIAVLTLPPHSVWNGENLSVNCHEGPIEVPVLPGRYTLHQKFRLAAFAPKCVLPFKASSVELAPEPALDPEWISVKEPFHGASKQDFGLRVLLRVVPGTKASKPEPTNLSVPAR